MRAERAPTGPRSVLRRIGGPLIAYHALILAGAYLIVLGYTDGSAGLEWVGAALVGAGILTELWVLVWSARSTRRAAALEPVGRPPGTSPSSSRPPAEFICVRCGRQEPGIHWTCPRCGGPSVPIPTAPSELGPPSSDRTP